jgi:hypothetical protein
VWDGRWRRPLCENPASRTAYWTRPFESQSDEGAPLQVWLLASPVAAHFNLGAPFVAVTIVLLIVSNLGKRRPGELSAYSLFNEGCRRLPGDLTKEQLDNAFRGRM